MTGKTGQSRRPLSGVIGPGLILALLASVSVLWSLRRGPALAPRSPASPPVGGSGLSHIPPPAPDLAFVLRRRSALRLSGRQIRQLEQLEQRFAHDTAEVRAELDEASASFARRMEARGGKGIRLPDLQAQAAAASELSRQFAAARRFYWSRAARVLTPAEQRQAEALWARQLFGVRKRASAFSPAVVTSSE